MLPGPCPGFLNVLLAAAVDPCLGGGEGGIGGGGGVSGSASEGGGASRNCEPKSAVRYPKLTTKVIVWVTPKVTKSTITLLVRLMVTLHVMNSGLLELSEATAS